MKYLNTLSEASASFVAKEHSVRFGNSEQCYMDYHIHPSAEIILVLSGEITLFIHGKEPERITSGECAFVFPFQSHAYERKEGCEYFRFNFVPSLLKTFFAPNENNIGDKSVFTVDIKEYAPFLELIRSGEVSLYKTKGFLYNIVGDYSRSVSFIKRHVSDNILHKVISYINEHMGEHINMVTAAAALGYNEKYLSRSINNAAGFGFSTLLSTLRVEKARDLLKHTDRTIVDIAIECGFGSERSFYRTFKSVTGFTPNEFRVSSPMKLVINDAVL